MTEEKPIIDKINEDMDQLKRSRRLAKDVFGDPIQDIIIPDLVDPDGAKKKRIIAKINEMIKSGNLWIEPSHEW